MDVVVVVKRKTDLFQLIRTLRPACSFSCRLDRRKKKGDQDADNGDNNEEFNERKGATT